MIEADREYAVSMESGLEGRNNKAVDVIDFVREKLSQWSPA